MVDYWQAVYLGDDWHEFENVLRRCHVISIQIDMVGKREGEERRGKEMSGGEKRGHCRI